MLILRNNHSALPPQFSIFAAGLIEKGLASFGRSLQRGVEKLLCPPPKRLLHGEPPALWQRIHCNDGYLNCRHYSSGGACRDSLIRNTCGDFVHLQTGTRARNGNPGD
jgi:hypothetical protein